MADKQWDAPPAMQIDAKKNYAVSIATNRGAIELELYPQHAPLTVNNFMFLAKQGFYDVTFHRVIDDFVIQTGDPTGSGRGGPGYRFADECGKATRSSTSAASSRWPMRGRTRTAASSSSRTFRRRI